MFRKKVKFSIKIIIEADNGCFHAFCPALKGLHVDGDTKDEARNNAVDAAIAYLESLIKHGDPIPLDVTCEEDHYPELPTMAPSPKYVYQVPVTV